MQDGGAIIWLNFQKNKNFARNCPKFKIVVYNVNIDKIKSRRLVSQELGIGGASPP